MCERLLPVVFLLLSIIRQTGVRSMPCRSRSRLGFRNFINELTLAYLWNRSCIAIGVDQQECASDTVSSMSLEGYLGSHLATF